MSGIYITKIHGARIRDEELTQKVSAAHLYQHVITLALSGAEVDKRAYCTIFNNDPSPLIYKDAAVAGGVNATPFIDYVVARTDESVPEMEWFPCLGDGLHSGGLIRGIRFYWNSDDKTSASVEGLVEDGIDSGLYTGEERPFYPLADTGYNCWDTVTQIY